MAILTEVLFHEWWLLPICGVFVGYVTNLIGIWMIFEPLEPTKWGPIKMHGLFLRRQKEVADVYAKIIADDIVTLRNLGYEMLHGPRADRTRQVIETGDAARGRPRGGRAQPGACGSRSARASTTRSGQSVATETVEYAVAPMTDPEFSRAAERQGAHADRRAHARDALRGLLGDAADRDARG